MNYQHSEPCVTMIKFPISIFFTFSCTVGLSQISCQISIYYEHYITRLLDLYFREFSTSINFPCSSSLLRIGVTDPRFSKMQQGLKL